MLPARKCHQYVLSTVDPYCTQNGVLAILSGIGLNITSCTLKQDLNIVLL